MDLITAKLNLNNWIAADTATQKGQTYSIDGLSLTRADAATITTKINYWQRVVNEHIDIDSGRQSGFRLPRWN